MDNGRDSQRIALLEQQVVQFGPALERHMAKSDEKLDKLTVAVTELTYQHRRISTLETGHESMKQAFQTSQLEMAAHTERLKETERLARAGIKATTALRDDVLHNKWNTVMIRSLIAVVLTGGVGMIGWIAKQLITEVIAK